MGARFPAMRVEISTRERLNEARVHVGPSEIQRLEEVELMLREMGDEIGGCVIREPRLPSFLRRSAPGSRGGADAFTIPEGRANTAKPVDAPCRRPRAGMLLTDRAPTPPVVKSGDGPSNGAVRDAGAVGRRRPQDTVDRHRQDVMHQSPVFLSNSSSNKPINASSFSLQR